MRSTIHLVTARDAFALRSWTQAALTRGFASSPFAKRLEGIEIESLVAFGREIVDDASLSRAALGRSLAARWPDGDQEAMAYAVAAHLPLVQVPPRGVWGRGGPVAWTSMERWLGGPLDERPDAGRWIIRYLAAFGPATVADIQAWSGVTGLRPAVEALRPELVTVRDHEGRELFDLPDAPRPDPDTPAPPRFLPEYDNVLLGHADRSRIIPPGRSIPLPPGNGASMGTILVDGMYAGTWRIARSSGRATLSIHPFDALRPDDRAALELEGARLLAFAASGIRPRYRGGNIVVVDCPDVRHVPQSAHGSRAGDRPDRDVERAAPLAGRRAVVRGDDRPLRHQPVDGRDQRLGREREPEREADRGEQGLRRLQCRRHERPVRAGHRRRRGAPGRDSRSGLQDRRRRPRHGAARVRRPARRRPDADLQPARRSVRGAAVGRPGLPRRVDRPDRRSDRRRQGPGHAAHRACPADPRRRPDGRSRPCHPRHQQHVHQRRHQRAHQQRASTRPCR